MLYLSIEATLKGVSDLCSSFVLDLGFLFFFMQLYGKTLCLPKGSSPSSSSSSKKPKGEPGIGGDLKSWKSIWYGRSTSKPPPVWFERRCGGSGSGSSGDATGISGSGIGGGGSGGVGDACGGDGRGDDDGRRELA